MLDCAVDPLRGKFVEAFWEQFKFWFSDKIFGSVTPAYSAQEYCAFQVGGDRRRFFIEFLGFIKIFEIIITMCIFLLDAKKFHRFCQMYSFL